MSTLTSLNLSPTPSPDLAVQLLTQHGFTYEYSQPNDYRFCLDSILLALYVSQNAAELNQTYTRILDVGAGCGVVGFELSNYFKNLTHIDFVEIQSEFKEHWIENLKRTNNQDKSFRYLQCNFESLVHRPELLNSYDLIIGNPPYFDPTQGHLPSTGLRKRCRFFTDSSLRGLLTTTIQLLKPGGQCYLLVRPQLHLERNVQLWVSGQAEIKWPALIRGTHVLHMTGLYK